MSEARVSAPATQRRFVDRSIVQLTLARFRGFIREPEAVFWTFVFPILLAVGLGVAFRSRAPERPHVALVTTAGISGAAEALKRDSSVIVETMDDTTAARALRTGKIALIARITGPASVDYIYDPARGDALTAKLLVDRAVQHSIARVDPIHTVEREVTERGSRYIDFVLPGLLGMNLMGSGIWGIGFAIVDQRAKKLLKRFMATPMSRAEYLASFMFSRLFFLILEVIALLGFGVLVFGVPIRGSLLALAGICLLATLSFGALGLLVSSSNFPKAVQPIIKVLPLTAVNDALRANMLEGASFATVSGEMLVIAGWLVLSFLLALKLFRWR